MDFTSIVIKNMKTVKNYTPYCGNNTPRGFANGCDNPRTIFDIKLNQFKCPHCGWVSKHTQKDINDYKQFNHLIEIRII